MEQQFQPALDAYVAGGRAAGGGDGGKAGPSRDLADAELAKAVEWDQRSAYPFDAYLPVLHLARARGLPLVALGVDRQVGCLHAPPSPYP